MSNPLAGVTTNLRDPFSHPGLIWRSMLLVLIAILVRYDSFAGRLSGAHGFRQAQTASIIRCLAEGRGTFFHPTSELGMPNDPMAVEPPVYQAILGTVCRYFGYSETMLRSFSVLCGLVTGLALALLVHTLTASRTAAWLCGAFYFGAILPAFFHATPMPDNLILAIVAVALWLFGRAAASPSGLSHGAALLTGAFAIGLKPPLCVGLVFAACCLLRRRLNAARAFGFIAMMVLAGGVMAAAWGVWASFISKGTYFAFIFDPKFSFQWNFGWRTLLGSQYYVLSAERCIQQVAWVAVPFVLLACIRRNQNPFRTFVLVWLVGEITGFLVFANLNCIHNYYQLRVSLFAAVAGALGWFALTNGAGTRLEKIAANRHLVTALGLVSVLMPLPMLGRHQFVTDHLTQIFRAGVRIQTFPRTKLVAGIDRFAWDYPLPYAAHRQMFLITQFKIGAFSYDNFDAFASALIDDVYVVGNPWVSEGRMGYVDDAFVAKVHDYLNENYLLKEEDGALHYYVRKHP